MLSLSTWKLSVAGTWGIIYTQLLILLKYVQKYPLVELKSIDKM